MKDIDYKPPFETLDPPPGGLSHLRSRIKKDRRRRMRNLSLATAAGSMAVIALVVVLQVPGGGETLQLPGIESDLLAIEIGLVEPPEETVSIRPDLRRQYAVKEIPTENEQVVFYLVGSKGLKN